MHLHVLSFSVNLENSLYIYVSWFLVLVLSLALVSRLWLALFEEETVSLVAEDG